MAPSPSSRTRHPMDVAHATGRDMTLRTFGAFLAIAFGLGWGLAALPILFPDQIQALTGPIGYTNPLFILAVYSPGIAGVFLVWRHFGSAGLKRYLRRLTLWRMPVA